MASLEDIRTLTDGAMVLAAGRTLGMTDDEAISTKRAAVRRNIERRRADRKAREGNRAAAEAFLAEDDANFNAKGGLTPFERQLALGGKVQVDLDDEAFAFGEDPRVILDDNGRRVEMEPRRPQDDDQNYSREEKVRNDVLGSDFLQSQEVAQQREGRGRAQAGLGGMRDALNRLEMAKEQYGFQAFGKEGEEMERLYYALKDDIGDGQQGQRNRAEAQKAVLADAEQRRGNVSDDSIAAAGRQVEANVRDERKRRVEGLQGPAQRQVFKRPGQPVKEALVPPFAYVEKPELRLAARARNPQAVVNPAAVGQRVIEEGIARRADGRAGGPEFRAIMNEAAAGAEAARIGDNNAGIARQFAQQNLDAVPPIAQLGAAGPAAHGDLHEDNLRFGGVERANNFGQADPLVDAKGNVLAYFGDEGGNMVQLGEVNSVDSANTLNAPKATPMMQWVAENQPAYGKNGVFGVPEADFNEAMALIGDRARGLQGLGFESMGNPRSLQEVEKVMAAVVGRGQAAGKQFYRFDKELGKNVAVSQPGVAEVMNMMRIPPAQQEMVAFALMQDALANAQDVNQADKQAFRGRVARPPGKNVNMNAPELRVDGGLPIDMIKNEKVGRGKKARGVRAALAGIDSDPVLQALNERGELFTQGLKKDAKGNVRKVQVLLPEAARIIEGAAQARNAAQMPMQAAIRGEGVQRARFVSPAGRKMNTQQMVEKYGAENAGIAKEVMARYDRAEAARQASPIDPGAEIQRRKDAQIASMGRRAERDFENVQLQRMGIGLKSTRPVQPIAKAATPASIAPQPGAGTGSQPVPMIDAGGGMQKPPTSRGAAAPAPGAGGPMPESMRNKLFSLPGPYQKKLMGEPDGPERASSAAGRQIKDIATNPKYQRGRRIAYGAGGTIAGLAAALGISNIGKEEEEVQV